MALLDNHKTHLPIWEKLRTFGISSYWVAVDVWRWVHCALLAPALRDTEPNYYSLKTLQNLSQNTGYLAI